MFSWALFIGIAALAIAPLLYFTFEASTKRAEIPPNAPAPLRLMHGLGFNPEDGSLYVATLRGLFVIVSQDRAERIAGSFQENRGFTVVGPDTFLASGRPDLRDLADDLAPEKSGLIRSTNGGRTWSAVSLRGEASFGCLESAHGLIYGYDNSSGAFMVSRDNGKKWDTRATLPALSDIAIDPSNQDRIIATTSEGSVLQSEDGGNSWQPRAGLSLMLVEWRQAGQLWAVESSGNVVSSSDSGLTWSVRGALTGIPRAFLAGRGTLYAAVDESTVLTSVDGAQTWQIVYQNAEDP
jgi:hypothetical protein